MSKRFKVRPSEILDIEDAYTAYCFDEACVYILSKIENGEKPNFKKFDKTILLFNNKYILIYYG